MQENTYRLDVQLADQMLCCMHLDVYFVPSKFGLLNVNDFSLINFILLSANLKLLKTNLMLLNNIFLNAKAISKLLVEPTKVIS